MDDLFKQAIVLIYPDGYVERIPIGTTYPHSLILKEHLAESKRFCDLCGHLDFDVGFHMHIDLVLLENQVIAIYNYSLKEIIEDPSYIYNFPPQFKVFIGNKYGSEQQRIEFEKLSDVYGTLFVPFLYDIDKHDFVSEIERKTKL